MDLFDVADDESSVVHGVVTSEGLFDATVITPTDEIYIEPTTRYTHLVHQDTNNYSTIAYRACDVAVPPSLHLQYIRMNKNNLDNDPFNSTRV